MADLKQQKQKQPENGSPRYADEVQNELEPQVELATSLPQAQLEQPQLRTPQTILRMQGLIGNRATQQFVGLSVATKNVQRQNEEDSKEEKELEESEPVAEEKLSQAGADEPPPSADDNNGNGAGNGGNDGAGSNGANGNNSGSSQPNGKPQHHFISSLIQPIPTAAIAARQIQRAPENSNTGGGTPSSPADTTPAPESKPAETPAPSNNTGGNESKETESETGNSGAQSTNTSSSSSTSSNSGSSSSSPTGTGGGSPTAQTTGTESGDTPAPDSGSEATSGLFSREALPETDQKGISAVKQDAKAAGAAYGDLPKGSENVGDARRAVTEPSDETKGRAEGDLMADLAAEPGPSPEILELCDRIREAIRNKRPPDEDSLMDTKPDELAKDAGKQLNSSLEDKSKEVQDGYSEMEGTPSGQREQTGTSMTQIPEQPSGVPQMNVEEAVPKPVNSEDVSLDAEVEQQQESLDTALEGKEETAALVESGPVAEAREGQEELKKTAEEDPAEVLKKHQEILANTQASMQELQQQALANLEMVRQGTRTRMTDQKGNMVESEEQQRARIGQQANTIYENAQARVQALLEKVPQTAMARWDAGVKVHSHNFKTHLDVVAKYIEDRHSGVIGAITEVGDSIFGLPDWITEAYNSAERIFGDNVCNLLKEISTEVNTVIRTCQQIIQEARKQIHELFSSLPKDMQKWAAEQQAQFDNKLNGLNQQVLTTRNNFNKQLVNKASEAVQKAREEVHALREKAKGLIQKIQDAINAFIEDPAKFIINGLLELLGIAASAFWAVVNKIQSAIDFIAAKPMEFANNLVNALSAGFQKFFDNFSTHLMDGLFSWLFSRLTDVGVEAPSDFSPKSIITFFMQVMGFTWERIKKILTKIIGEENMELIEQAWDMISMLIEKGPEGIFELIADALDPKKIIDSIIDTAIEFVVETLIKQVALRLLGMLNPAGAIIQAIEIIYKVMSWIFENASKIFSLIETIVGGISNIIAGNIGGIATAIEMSLSKLLPIVIDFLADLLGLGGLPNKVAKAIGGIQEFVEKAITEALEFIATKAKTLLGKLGIGGKDDDKDKDEKENAEAEGEENLTDKQKAGIARLKIKTKEYYDDPEKKDIEKEEAEKAASETKAEYPHEFSFIKVLDAGPIWEYEYEVIQRAKLPAGKKDTDDDENICTPENMKKAKDILKTLTAPGDICADMVQLGDVTFQRYKQEYEDVYLPSKAGFTFQWPLFYLKGRSARKRGKVDEAHWAEKRYPGYSKVGYLVEDPDTEEEVHVYPDVTSGNIIADVKDVQEQAFTPQLHLFYIVAKGEDINGIKRTRKTLDGKKVTGKKQLGLIVRNNQHSEGETRVFGPVSSNYKIHRDIHDQAEDES